MRTLQQRLQNHAFCKRNNPNQQQRTIPGRNSGRPGHAKPGKAEPAARRAGGLTSAALVLPPRLDLLLYVAHRQQPHLLHLQAVGQRQCSAGKQG